MDTVTLFSKTFTKGQWPLWHHVCWGVTLPKDHCVQVPWEYINVLGYSHTTSHVHTYKMSDHIVTFWIKFRQDKKVGFSLEIKFWFRGYFWTKSCLRKNLGTKPCKILIWGYFLRKKGKSLRNILKISDHSCVHIVNICAPPPTHTHTLGTGYWNSSVLVNTGTFPVYVLLLQKNWIFLKTYRLTLHINDSKVGNQINSIVKTQKLNLAFYN